MDHKKNIALSSDETLRHQSHEANCLPVTRLTHPGRERRGRGSSESGYSQRNLTRTTYIWVSQRTQDTRGMKETGGKRSKLLPKRY